MKSKKKTERIQLRLTLKDKEIITQNAEESGMTLTDYIIKKSKNKDATHVDYNNSKPTAISKAVVSLTQLTNDINHKYSYDEKINKELKKIWEIISMME